MLEKFEAFKNVLVSMGLWTPLLAGTNIFIPILGMVYLFGAMLNIAKTNVQKNTVAAITTFASSILFFTFKDNPIFWQIWTPYFIACIGIILYVLIGFSLRSRIDTLLDKFAKDKPIKEDKPKAKPVKRIRKDAK